MMPNPTGMKITSPTLHATVIFTITVFIVILVMSFVFKVEVVARGEGRVMPIGRVQVVQPEFSGRIIAIHVRNGVSVARGDTLIELDATKARAELGTIRAEQDRLRIERARLQATVATLALDPAENDLLRQARRFYDVPEDFLDHPYAEEQGDLLDAEIADHLASIAQIAAREESNRRSEAVTKANVERVDAALDIQTERLGTSEQLLEKGTTSRSAYLDVQQNFIDLRREKDVYLRELEQKEAQRIALDAERRRLNAEWRRSLLDRRSQIDARLATLDEEQRAAARRVAAARLQAPVSGVVDQLEVFTVGGVAEAGSELLRIVPTDAEVEIEGTFSNQDIGFMEVGQSANIRLDAYPSERFGFIPGNVSDIAADSSEVSAGEWGYVARIEPNRDYLEAGDDKLMLRPGMTATIDVTTDKRRIISYFFAPIVGTIQDAMGER